MLILSLIASVPVFVLSTLIALGLTFHNSQVKGIFGVISSIIFLIFLKYALADPLIVLEQRGAWDALARSWEMTKGRFVYVLGCYVFLGGGIWLITWLMQKLDDRLTGADYLSQLSYVLLDSLWIVMAWVMYFRIKAADAPPVAHSEGPLEADPSTSSG